MSHALPQRLAGAMLFFVCVSAAYLLVDWRGWNLWGLQLFETAEAMAAWRNGGAIEPAFAGPHGVFPLIPWLAAVLGPSVETMRFLAAMAGGATAAMVFAWAHRADGAVAGVVAALALALNPTWVGAVSSASPTVFTVCSLVAVWVSLRAALEDQRWTPALWGAACFAAQTSFLGWLVWLPAGWLLLARPTRNVDFGLVELRRVPVGALIAPIVGVGSLLAYAWFRTDTGGRIGGLLEVWMTRPAEPYLVGGERFGPHRLDAWLPPMLWWRSTPVWVSVCALAGLAFPVARGRAVSTTRGPEDVAGEARRFAVVALVASWLLPVGFGTAWFAGTDLLVAAAAPASVLAGTGASLAWSSVRRTQTSPAAISLLLAVVIGAAAASVADLRRTRGVAEAYVPGMLGGVPGRLARGMSRAQHLPLAPEWAQAAVELADGGGVHVLTNAWEGRPLFEAYARLGVVDTPVAWSSATEANVVVVWYDDALPELYESAADVASLRRLAADRYEVIVDGTPLWGAYRVR